MVFPVSVELLAAARVYISDILGLPSHYLIINSKYKYPNTHTHTQG